MLSLLRPWNDLLELKVGDETFEQAFRSFMDGAPKKVLDIVKNIQYYYKCYDGAMRRREENMESRTDGAAYIEEDIRHEDSTTDSLDFPSEIEEVTDELIDEVYEARGGMRERLYAEVALNTAFDCEVFSNATLHTVFLPMPDKAQTDDLNRFHAWEECLKAVCRREREEGGPTLFASIDGAAPALVAVDGLLGIEAT